MELGRNLYDIGTEVFNMQTPVKPGFGLRDELDTKHIDRGQYRAAVKKTRDKRINVLDPRLTNTANKIGAAMLFDPSLNPANLLQAVGSNPLKRGREKVNHTLLWLATFVRSTQAIILQRLGIQARGWMRKLERDGYVKPVLSNVNSGELWVLTQEGLQAAQGVWSKQFAFYPDRPERLSQANLRHDLAVQKLVAEMVANGDATAFLHPSEIGGNSQEWRPDSIIKHKEGYWVGIEYERSPKYNDERLVKLNRITKYLNKANKNELTFVVHWFSHHKECLIEYQKIMQSGMAFRDYSSNQKKWVEASYFRNQKEYEDSHPHNNDDDWDAERIRKLRNKNSIKVTLLDKDLAKYM